MIKSIYKSYASAVEKKERDLSHIYSKAVETTSVWLSKSRSMEKCFAWENFNTRCLAMSWGSSKHNHHGAQGLTFIY